MQRPNVSWQKIEFLTKRVSSLRSLGDMRSKHNCSDSLHPMMSKDSHRFMRCVWYCIHQEIHSDEILKTHFRQQYSLLVCRLRISFSLQHFQHFQHFHRNMPLSSWRKLRLLEAKLMQRDPCEIHKHDQGRIWLITHLTFKSRIRRWRDNIPIRIFPAFGGIHQDIVQNEGTWHPKSWSTAVWNAPKLWNLEKQHLQWLLWWSQFWDFWCKSHSDVAPPLMEASFFVSFGCIQLNGFKSFHVAFVEA